MPELTTVEPYFLRLARDAGRDPDTDRGRAFAAYVQQATWTRCVPAIELPVILDASTRYADELLPCACGVSAAPGPAPKSQGFMARPSPPPPCAHADGCPARFRPAVATALCECCAMSYQRACRGCEDPRCQRRRRETESDWEAEEREELEEEGFGPDDLVVLFEERDLVAAHDALDCAPGDPHRCFVEFLDDLSVEGRGLRRLLHDGDPLMVRRGAFRTGRRSAAEVLLHRALQELADEQPELVQAVLVDGDMEGARSMGVQQGRHELSTLAAKLLRRALGAVR
jgi:hypothetical protein